MIWVVLYDEGKIRLDDLVSKYIPEFSGGEKDRVTIRQLLEEVSDPARVERLR